MSRAPVFAAPLLSAPLLSALVLASALLAPAPARAQAQATPEQEAEWEREFRAAELSDCKPGSMGRCWYLFFAINEAPYRQIFLVDIQVRKPEPGNADLVEIDVVEAHEGDDPKVAGANDFVSYTMQFKCQQKSMRVLSGYAYMLDGNIDRAREPSQWMSGYDNHWYGMVGKIACDKKVRQMPLAHHMLWLGPMYRPVDVVDLGRRMFWKK